jgi:hypothetical protein
MELKFFQSALFKGRTPNAIKLGTILMLGRFWLRPSGCHTIYRGQDGIINYDDIQAVMGIDDDEITVPAQELAAGTNWHYVRRQCSGCGLESADSPAAVIAINPAGDYIGQLPNNPQTITAELVAGGKIRLRWRYVKKGQEIAPSGFKIYINDGSGFDFENPDATVPYRGSVEYTWLSDALTHGRRYKFAVRSYALNAGATNNTDFVAAIADSQGPAAASGLEISWQVS